MPLAFDRNYFDGESLVASKLLRMIDRIWLQLTVQLAHEVYEDWVDIVIFHFCPHPRSQNGSILMISLRVVTRESLA
jgi:hypothetical protein